jgi:hypothetical protein
MEIKQSSPETYVPKGHNGRFVIVIKATIIRIAPQIIKINGRIHPSKEDLDFLLIEHPKEWRTSIKPYSHRKIKRHT